MVVKVYVALISCSQEVKKNQQRTIMILESKKIPYTIIDITDPCNEESKDYMVENAVAKEGMKVPVTPQIFNEADYCGDYDGLDMANECDTLGDFLKLTDEEKAAIKIGITGIILPNENQPCEDVTLSNGVSTSREVSPEKAAVIEEKVNEEQQPSVEAPPPSEEPINAPTTAPEETKVLETRAPTEKSQAADEESSEEDTTTTEVKRIKEDGEIDLKNLEENQIEDVVLEEIADVAQLDSTEREEATVDENDVRDENMEED